MAVQSIELDERRGERRRRPPARRLMAGLTSQERLQPSLLDRLTDDAARRARARRSTRACSTSSSCARRCCATWPGCSTRPATSPSPTRGDPSERARCGSDAPHARDSVLNFGIPSLSGITLSVARLRGASRQRSAQAIVRLRAAHRPEDARGRDRQRHGSGIQHEQPAPGHPGQMWNQPVPLELLLSADVDVETGQAAVRDMRG